METSTSWPCPVCLPLQQGQQDADVGEAGGRVVALIAARTDGRDRVVVVAAAVQRTAGASADQVGADYVGPGPVEPERGQ